MADNYWCHPKVDIQSMYEAEVGSISTAISGLKSSSTELKEMESTTELKYMRQYILWIGLGLLLIGCSTENIIVGKYMSKNNPNYLQLKKDNTFIYEYRALHLYQQSTGKWTKKNGTLILLDSEIMNTSIPLNITSLSQTRHEDNLISLKLDIEGNLSLFDYKCGIYVNDSIICFIRCDSLTSIKIGEPINDIYFKFIREPVATTTTAISLPLITDKYTPAVATGNTVSINVEFSDTYFYYKVFNNEAMKVTPNGIKMYNERKRKWEKIRRVSDSLNIFSRYSDRSQGLNTFH